MEPLCIVDAKAIYRLHAANHITLMWCQEMIYENGSLLSLSRARPGWTRSVDTKPVRSRKQELADLSFITSQWVLFPAPDEIPAVRSHPGVWGISPGFYRVAKCFNVRMMLWDNDGKRRCKSVIWWETTKSRNILQVWTHLSRSCIISRVK